jgi:hypothetical protein
MSSVTDSDFPLNESVLTARSASDDRRLFRLPEHSLIVLRRNDDRTFDVAATIRPLAAKHSAQIS